MDGTFFEVPEYWVVYKSKPRALPGLKKEMIAQGRWIEEDDEFSTALNEGGWEVEKEEEEFDTKEEAKAKAEQRKVIEEELRLEEEKRLEEKKKRSYKRLNKTLCKELNKAKGNENKKTPVNLFKQVNDYNESRGFKKKTKNEEEKDEEVIDTSRSNRTRGNKRKSNRGRGVKSRGRGRNTKSTTI
jgi:hypothetical protein